MTDLFKNLRIASLVVLLGLPLGFSACVTEEPEVLTCEEQIEADNTSDGTVNRYTVSGNIERLVGTLTVSMSYDAIFNDEDDPTQCQPARRVVNELTLSSFLGGLNSIQGTNAVRGEIRFRDELYNGTDIELAIVSQPQWVSVDENGLPLESTPHCYFNEGTVIDPVRILGYNASISGANIADLSIQCDPTAGAEFYTIGGTITGAATPIDVELNGGDPVLLDQDNGSFVFMRDDEAQPGILTDGQAYSVDVVEPPAGQFCLVRNGTGSINGANVTNIEIECLPLNGYPICVTVQSEIGAEDVRVLLQAEGQTTEGVWNSGPDQCFQTAGGDPRLVETFQPYYVEVLPEDYPKGTTCIAYNGGDAANPLIMGRPEDPNDTTFRVDGIFVVCQNGFQTTPGGAMATNMSTSVPILDSPNGGELFYVGFDYSIQWREDPLLTGANRIDAVLELWSYDSGSDTSTYVTDITRNGTSQEPEPFGCDTFCEYLWQPNRNDIDINPLVDSDGDLDPANDVDIPAVTPGQYIIKVRQEDPPGPATCDLPQCQSEMAFEVRDDFPWQFTREITINSAKSNPEVTYAMPLILDSDNFDYTNVDEEGDDIRFSFNATPTSEADFDIPYWIQRWRPEGETVIWIDLQDRGSVNGLEPGINTIYMFYGYELAQRKSNFSTVFDPSLQYRSRSTSPLSSSAAPADQIYDFVDLQDGQTLRLSTSITAVEIDTHAMWLGATVDGSGTSLASDCLATDGVDNDPGSDYDGNGGGGGGYGGTGGDGGTDTAANGTQGGITFGTSNQPNIDPGCIGGSGVRAGTNFGRGGGGIGIVAEWLLMSEDAAIIMDGSNGDSGIGGGAGGGSGGGIYLDVTNGFVRGTFRANGGNGGDGLVAGINDAGGGGGGGGAGRFKFFYSATGVPADERPTWSSPADPENDDVVLQGGEGGSGNGGGGDGDPGNESPPFENPGLPGSVTTTVGAEMPL